MTNRGPGDQLPPIKFEALASALLDRAEALVAQWLPGGKREGREYKCGSLSGGAGSSCSVNMTNGRWSDFATDEKGGDLIGLYAAIHGLDMGKSAVQLARELGLEDVAGVTRDANTVPRPAPPPRPEPEPRKPEPEGWVTVLPVPPFAPEPTFQHFHREASDITHTAIYQMDGHLQGFVVRFRTSDGGKDTLPYTWCVSARDGAAKWTWRQFDEPRPLFFPGGVSPIGLYNDGQRPRTVIIVEGEKKAMALQDLLDAGAPGIYLVASWPGGSKAWKKASWDWLAGCNVLLWPDCDAKRVQLTKAERESAADELAREVLQQAKPLLPVHRQPGMSAMLGIGHLLEAEHMAQVQLLPIPAPGEVVDGWDCDDAINTDGWDYGRVIAFFGRAQPLPAPDGDDAATGSPGGKARGSGVNADAAGGGDGPPEKKIDGLAGAGGGDDAFQDYLQFVCDKLKIERHQLALNRKVVITALRKSPMLQDCLGYNELTGAPSTRVAWPWREDPGPLADNDDLRLGDWLGSAYQLKAASRAALSEAVDTVADERRFHPIRDWLTSLKHDGTVRQDKWLIHVLGLDPDALPPKRRRYLELMGRYLLRGLVKRVLQPGCKFDYSPVFEGVTGMGKSTLVKTLVGAEYFSDTHFDIGAGKDGFEQLEGLWGYELSELTALRRADSEQVKGFFSSTIDRFRGAYGKFVQPHPRQCVIFCTTNKRQYLYDLTGNRRFWPVWIDREVRISWLAKWREQLFAEAYAMLQAGESYYPSREDEQTYFYPEQELRLVETAVQSRLYELLTREGAPGGENKTSADINQLTKFVTLDRLVAALGADAAKSNNVLEGQIRGWLEAQGWEYGRESTGQRRRGYRQPKVWPPEISDEEPTEPVGGGDGSPGAGETIQEPDDAPF